MDKCQYHRCNDEATEYAIGYDKSGDDQVYHVCRRHAEEMEPIAFTPKQSISSTRLMLS